MLRTIGKLLFFLRFMPSFTAPMYRQRQKNFAALPDQTGKTWLVTGATGGIGLAISQAAVRLGATVIAVGRNPVALQHLTEQVSGSTRLIPHIADLSLLNDIEQMAERLQQNQLGVDVLVNNVGVLLHQRELTREGHDKTLACNLLGHYHLTELLKSTDLLASGARVINMSSGGMYNVPLVLKNLTDRSSDASAYDGVLNYAIQKRAQVVLNDHWQEHDTSRHYYVMHPGWVDTVGVQTALPDFRKLLKSILRTPEMGADTALWLGSMEVNQSGGGIWFDRKLRPAHIYRGTRSASAGASMLVSALRQMIANTEEVDQEKTTHSGIAASSSSNANMRIE